MLFLCVKIAVPLIVPLTDFTDGFFCGLFSRARRRPKANKKYYKILLFSIDSDERAPRNTVKSRIFCRRLRKMWGFVRFSLVFCTVTRRNCSSLQPFFVRRSATNLPHKNGRGTPPLPLFIPFPGVCYSRRFLSAIYASRIGSASASVLSSTSFTISSLSLL